MSGAHHARRRSPRLHYVTCITKTIFLLATFVFVGQRCLLEDFLLRPGFLVVGNTPRKIFLGRKLFPEDFLRLTIIPTSSLVGNWSPTYFRRVVINFIGRRRTRKDFLRNGSLDLAIAVKIYVKKDSPSS